MSSAISPPLERCCDHLFVKQRNCKKGKKAKQNSRPVCSPVFQRVVFSLSLFPFVYFIYQCVALLLPCRELNAFPPKSTSSLQSHYKELLTKQKKMYKIITPWLCGPRHVQAQHYCFSFVYPPSPRSFICVRVCLYLPLQR